MQAALNRYGSFYRVSLDGPEEVQFSGRYLNPDSIAADCVVRSTDESYRVSAVPHPPNAEHTPRSLHDQSVDVYLDGAYLRHTSWRSTDQEWIAAVSLDDHTQLQITALVTLDRLPEELSIIRDHP